MALAADRTFPLSPMCQVLSKLYVTRSDVQYAVRNGALHNWKTLVVREVQGLTCLLLSWEGLLA